MRPVRVELGNGESVIVAGRLLDPAEDVAFGLPTMPFDQLVAGVELLFADVRSRLDRIKPDELSIRAQVGVAIESGKIMSYLASGELNASFEVEMKWTSKSE